MVELTFSHQFYSLEISFSYEFHSFEFTSKIASESYAQQSYSCSHNLNLILNLAPVPALEKNPLDENRNQIQNPIQSVNQG